MFLGMFLELLRFFMGEGEWTVVEPHERLTWIRHLSRSAWNRGVRFAVVVGVRNALIISILTGTVAGR